MAGVLQLGCRRHAIQYGAFGASPSSSGVPSWQGGSGCAWGVSLPAMSSPCFLRISLSLGLPSTELESLPRLSKSQTSRRDYAGFVEPHFIGLTMRRKRQRGERRGFVEAYSASETQQAEKEFVCVLGKPILKRNLHITCTAIATVLLSVSNKVLYKMALVPLKDYPFFLAQLTTFGYVVVYSTVLYVRYRAGIVTKEMLALPKVRFIAIGALEALGIAANMASAAVLAGTFIPILTQAFLVWQLVLSATILRRRYTLGQVFGCLMVVAGVVVVVASGSGGVDGHSLQQSGFLWPLVMIISNLFLAGASIIKEFLFEESERNLQGGSLDIFVVNSLGSGFQALFVFLLLPFLSSMRGLSFQQMPAYFNEGMACFVNMGSLVKGCEGAPFLPFLYVLANLTFNIFSLSLLKQSSAIMSSFCVTLSVPIAIWAFTLPLPYLGAPATIPPGLCVGAAILMAGLASYNFSGQSIKKTLTI